MSYLKITDDQLIDGKIPDWLLNDGIANLDLSFCRSLTQLPALPPGIINLDLRGCASLTQLPDNLPAGIAKLDLSYCRSLTQLPDNLPAGITNLNLWNCALLTQLPDNLPAGITRLNLDGCASLTQLPDNLPAGITDPHLSFCRSLTQLPDNLPAGITKLDLSYCRSLTQLPDNLPAGITSLGLSGCRSLTQLPDNLPAGITSLDLRNCANLQPTPQLLHQLDEIERRHVNSDVRRPGHWRARDVIGQVGGDVGEARSELAELIDQLTARLNAVVRDSGIDPTPIYDPDTGETRHVYTILDIFERFATQNIRYDRKIEDIILTTMPIIELLEKDPSHLKWMEKMASHYLQGCVNQPVQAFIEIAGFVGVCQAEKIADKMEASKAILARMAITAFFATLPPKDRPGQGTEVEYGNVMISKVHEEFRKNGYITKPWPGIPTAIAYQGIVSGKVNAGFEDACGFLKAEVLDLSRKEIAERLLGFLDGGAEGKDPPHRHIALAWMDVMLKGNPALERKAQEIDAKYEKETDSIEENVNFLVFAEKINERGLEVALRVYREDPHKDEFLKRYKEEITGTPAEKAKKLNELKKQVDPALIELRKEEEKVELIKSKVAEKERSEWQPSSLPFSGVAGGAAEHVASRSASPQAGKGPPLKGGRE